MNEPTAPIPTSTFDWSFRHVQALTQAHGNAFYVVDLNRFESNVVRFVDAFRNYYPNVCLAYSYKTNYVPSVCLKADQLGAFAEVVSPFEYNLAIRLGIAPERIIYNGPIKPFASIKSAIRANSVVNLDSQEEFEFVVGLAGKHTDQQFRVGLRINVGLEPDNGSRFGLNLATGQVQAIFEQIKRLSNVHVVSLHTHYSHQRDAGSYAERARRLGDVYQTFAKDCPIEIFDIGGGYFGEIPDQIVSQFSAPPPTYEDYASHVGPIVQSIFDGELQPQLVLEPGVGVIADAISFVCEVESIKTGKGRMIANTSGGVQNIKPNKNRFQLPIQVLSSSNETTQTKDGLPTDICGYTCMEDDVLYYDYRGPVSVGDFIVFHNVGAYSIVFKPPFIRTNPAILRWDGLGEIQVERRAETLDDVFITYESYPR